mmetsp:Transcript_11472/g.34006  ORF Transcript_11472/g.34006 Transcript_11472/m.34006 type:complete len:206 (+) Transcript_11472:1262-1879(+)
MTSRRLERMEPRSESCTTRSRPALMAKMLMISSVALPRVALRSPPITSLLYRATSSVASPKSCASGMMPTKLATKMTQSGNPSWGAATPSATKGSSTLRTEPVRAYLREVPWVGRTPDWTEEVDCRGVASLPAKSHADPAVESSSRSCFRAACLSFTTDMKRRAIMALRKLSTSHSGRGGVERAVCGGVERRAFSRGSSDMPGRQ